MSGLSANHGKCDGPPTDTTYVSIGGPVLARGRPRIEAARDQPVGSAGCTQVSRLVGGVAVLLRSEEHTSELQSLMRTSYAVFCLKKQTTKTHKSNKRLHPTEEKPR